MSGFKIIMIQKRNNKFSNFKFFKSNLSNNSMFITLEGILSFYYQLNL